MRTDKEVERLRRLCDPARWPVKAEDVMIVDGEVWTYRTDHPLEECIYRPLYRWP